MSCWDKNTKVTKHSVKGNWEVMGISILFAAQTMTYLGVIWKTQQQYYQDEKCHKLRVAEDRIEK